jgi:hypothetical protein
MIASIASHCALSLLLWRSAPARSMHTKVALRHTPTPSTTRVVNVNAQCDRDDPPRAFFVAGFILVEAVVRFERTSFSTSNTSLDDSTRHCLAPRISPFSTLTCAWSSSKSKPWQK